MTRDPLPWDDPNRDIGADMVVNLGQRVMDGRGIDATAAAHLAAQQIRRTFTLGQESIAEAIRQMTQGAQTSVASLRSFTDEVRAAQHHVWTQPDEPDAPKYPIDTSRRRPVYGYFTEADVDLDHERIGAEFERLLKKHRADEAFWRIRSSMDVLAWLDRRRDPRYRTGWDEWMRIFPADHTVRWHHPRGQGKTKERAESLHRMMALGGGRMEVGPGYVAIYDETRRYYESGRLDYWDDEVARADLASWTAEFRRVTRQAVAQVHAPKNRWLNERLEPYRRAIAGDVRHLAEKSGVSMNLLGPEWTDVGECSTDGWTTTAADPAD